MKGFADNIEDRTEDNRDFRHVLYTGKNLQLVLSPPKGPGGGSQAMPDGRRPEPGGWNRIIVQSTDLERDVDALRKAGIEFRNEIVAGPGGRRATMR